MGITIFSPAINKDQSIISLEINEEYDFFKQRKVHASIYNEGGEYIGFVEASREFTWFHIDINQNKRNQGYGTTALTTFMDYLFNAYDLEQINNIALNPSHPQLDNIKKFYRKCGFEVSDGFMPFMCCKKDTFYKKFPEFSRTLDPSGNVKLDGFGVRVTEIFK